MYTYTCHSRQYVYLLYLRIYKIMGYIYIYICMYATHKFHTGCTYELRAAIRRVAGGRQASPYGSCRRRGTHVPVQMQLRLAKLQFEESYEDGLPAAASARISILLSIPLTRSQLLEVS